VCQSKKEGHLTLMCNDCHDYYTEGPSYAH
jgi:hypothetical protein